MHQSINRAARVSYLRIDGPEARLVLVHLEVELGGGDGQGAFHHHGRSHQLDAGAQVYWAWRTDTCRSERQAPTARRVVVGGTLCFSAAKVNI